MPSIARADQVGSLLRPVYTQEARQAFREGRATRADLDAVLDRAVREDVQLLEQSGIDVISDGEARRTNWIASLQMGGETSYVAPMGGIEPREVAPPNCGGRPRSSRDGRPRRAKRPGPVPSRSSRRRVRSWRGRG